MTYKIRCETGFGAIHEFAKADGLTMTYETDADGNDVTTVMLDHVKWASGWTPGLTSQPMTSGPFVLPRPMNPVNIASPMGENDVRLMLAAVLTMMGGSISFTKPELLEATKHMTALEVLRPSVGSENLIARIKENP